MLHWSAAANAFVIVPIEQIAVTVTWVKMVDTLQMIIVNIYSYMLSSKPPTTIKTGTARRCYTGVWPLMPLSMLPWNKKPSQTLEAKWWTFCKWSLWTYTHAFQQASKLTEENLGSQKSKSSTHTKILIDFCKYASSSCKQKHSFAILEILQNQCQLTAVRSMEWKRKRQEFSLLHGS